MSVGEKSESKGASLNEINLIYVQIEWADPFTRGDRISIAIFLPSGVAEHLGGMSKFSLNDVDVNVEGNRTVIVTIIWPSTMQQIEKLTEFWL